MDNSIQEALEKHEEGAIANHEKIKVFDKNKNKDKEVVVGFMMEQVISDILTRMDNWPRRVANTLFIDDPQHGLHYFDKTGQNGLFGWLRRHWPVKWNDSGGCVSKGELFAELGRTAQHYDGVEQYPHEPLVPNTYYRRTDIPVGDGKYLKRFVEFFTPDTTTDRDLITAAMLTVFWGGPAGLRPAFVVTSDEGRGVGKSTVVKKISQVCRGSNGEGHISVTDKDDINKLKTRILTPAMRDKRIVFLDNVKSLRFSWAEAESLITESIISGHQMYEGGGERPNLLTWMITLNGMALSTDIAQRSVVIKIAKANYSGKWEEAVDLFIERYRDRIIGDIIGLLRKPVAPPCDFEFSRWGAWEEAVLCKLANPNEAQQLIRERQGEADSETDEVEAVEEFIAEKLVYQGYHPPTICVRIPSRLVASWYCAAMHTKMRTDQACRRIKQFTTEGRMKRLAADASHSYGRCFIWTGEDASQRPATIENKLVEKFARGEVC